MSKFSNIYIICYIVFIAAGYIYYDFGFKEYIFFFNRKCVKSCIVKDFPYLYFLN